MTRLAHLLDLTADLLRVLGRQADLACCDVAWKLDGVTTALVRAERKRAHDDVDSYGGT